MATPSPTGPSPGALERKLLAGFGSTALILLLGAFSYQAIVSVNAAKASVGRTRDVRDLLRQTEIALVDAETRSRGYLLGGDAQFLDDYRASNSRLEELMVSLDEALAGEPALQPRLAELRSRLFDARNELVRIQQEYPALPLVRPTGPTPIDRARETIGALLVVQTGLLREREAGYESGLSSMSGVVIGGSLAAFLLGVWVNFWLRREVLERRRMEELTAGHSALLAEANRTLALAQEAAENALEERSVALAALEKSNRALNQFASVASHDLKAPLRGIANLAEWIDEDLGEAIPESSREHVRLMRTRVKRMEELIEGILTWSRAGGVRQPFEPIDVRPFVEEVVGLVAPAPGTTVVVEPMPVVQAPRVQFEQIWINLIGNAIKHTPAQAGEIRLGSHELKEAWEFSVSDNGPGIAPRYHQRIFELFQMLSSQDSIEGTGIGLAVVKKLVEGAGGRVWVESELGHGARFCFTWPKKPVLEARG